MKWWRRTFWQEMREERDVKERKFCIICSFYVPPCRVIHQTREESFFIVFLFAEDYYCKIL